MKKIGKLKTFNSKEINDSYVSIGFECLDRDLFTPEKCYEPLFETGVKYARCQTGWAKCEKEKGVYDFTWLDSVVDNLLARGVEPWFNIGYGNPVYMKNAAEGNVTCVGCVPIYYGEEVLNAWFNYVEALTIHFKDRVKYYEVWNEPDLKHFWYPEKTNPVAYANFLNDTASVVKKVFPNAKTGGCVSHYTNYPYLTKFFTAVKKEYLDFFSIHTYSTVPEQCIKEGVEFLKEQLLKNGLTDTELWQGEGGHPSWAYAGHHLAPNGCDDERAQAVWMLRRYFIDISLGMKMSSYYQMVDLWEKPYVKAVEILNKPAAHGILNGITYTPKKAYESMTILSTIFTKEIVPEKKFIQIRELTNGTSSDLVACQTFTFNKNSHPVFAYYWPLQIGETHPEAKTKLRIRDDLKDPVLIDTYDDTVYLLEPEDCDIQGAKVFFDYTFPITDYPIILTEKEAFEIIEE